MRPCLKTNKQKYPAECNQKSIKENVDFECYIGNIRLTTLNFLVKKLKEEGPTENKADKKKRK
jgi:hypothetical protein